MLTCWQFLPVETRGQDISAARVESIPATRFLPWRQKRTNPQNDRQWRILVSCGLLLGAGYTPEAASTTFTFGSNVYAILGISVDEIIGHRVKRDY